MHMTYGSEMLGYVDSDYVFVERVYAVDDAYAVGLNACGLAAYTADGSADACES